MITGVCLLVLARALLPASTAAATAREERVDEDGYDRMGESRSQVVASGLRWRHARARVDVAFHEEGRGVGTVGD